MACGGSQYSNDSTLLPPKKWSPSAGTDVKKERLESRSHRDHRLKIGATNRGRFLIPACRDSTVVGNAHPTLGAALLVGNAHPTSGAVR